MIATGNKENSLLSANDPLGVKLLTRLRLQFSQLSEYKFGHGFGDIVMICGCNAENEDTEHFLLRCQFCYIQIFELFNNINKVGLSLTQLDTKKTSQNFVVRSST